MFFVFFYTVNTNSGEMNVDDFVKSPLVLTTEVCNPGKCQAGKLDGVCINGESCFKHGGRIGSPCNGSENLICCTCQYQNAHRPCPRCVKGYNQSAYSTNLSEFKNFFHFYFLTEESPLPII